MGSVNKVIIVGNLGRDCELRYTPTGAPVATFSVATSEVWTGRDGKRQERTEWIRIVLFGKTAESLSEYLLKGRQVYVDGRIQSRKYKDKDDVERFISEIVAQRVVLLGNRDRSNGRDDGARHVKDEDVGHGEPSVTQSELDDETVPF